jgi:ADP-ribosylglycohydrolase
MTVRPPHYSKEELDLKERIEGGIYRLLVGDALGVPYEFHPQNEIPSLSEIEFDPPKYFERAHKTITPGTWSDDGAQALVLLASLLSCEKLDINNFAKGLVDWYEDGYMAVDGNVFDVGIQTGLAIRRLRLGVNAAISGQTDEQANGNGSLMVIVIVTHLFGRKLSTWRSHCIYLGIPDLETIVPSATLEARLVTIKGFQDAIAFVTAAQNHLDRLEIVGRVRVLNRP